MKGDCYLCPEVGPARGKRKFANEKEKHMKKFKMMDIESAFDFVNSCGFSDNSAVINRKTGEIYYLGDTVDEDLPEHFDEEDDSLIWIPNKHDLDLGSHLVMDFVQEYCPENLDEIHGIFSQLGAYSTLKEFLANKNLLEKWFSFEEEKTRQALLEWCQNNNLDIDIQAPKTMEESS